MTHLLRHLLAGAFWELLRSTSLSSEDGWVCGGDGGGGGIACALWIQGPQRERERADKTGLVCSRGMQSGGSEVAFQPATRHMEPGGCGGVGLN